MSWTDERIEQLRTMWTKGMTASQIAEELGGVSRNAVIGKAHRLGLQSRPSPVKANDGEDAPARKPSTPRAKPAPVAAPAAPLAKAQPAPVRPAAAPAMPSAPRSTNPDQMPPTIRSIGPGGFVRQNPGEQSSPPPPAPPRRLVPARPSPEIADKTSLLDLNDRICKWPLGHPGEPDFHFCGTKVNPGFPYCVDHCGLAYQAQMPRRDRKPLPFAVPGAKPSGG
jgi:GcrA cell cycle regulator